MNRNCIDIKEIGDFNRVFGTRQHEAAIFVKRQAEVTQYTERRMCVQKRQSRRLHIRFEFLCKCRICHDLRDAVVGQHKMLSANGGEFVHNALADTVRQAMQRVEMGHWNHVFSFCWVFVCHRFK